MDNITNNPIVKNLVIAMEKHIITMQLEKKQHRYNIKSWDKTIIKFDTTVDCLFRMCDNISDATLLLKVFENMHSESISLHKYNSPEDFYYPQEAETF